MPCWSAVAATVLPYAGASIGSIYLREEFYSKDGKKQLWHKTLKKSRLSPPEWVFGPVWTGLYLSMGYASYLVYRDGGGFQGEAKLPLIVYGTQLALNWAWPYIFFGAHNMKWGFIEILALDAAVATCGILFHKINPTAGYLYIPYMAWLSFASVLSYRNWQLNKVEESPKIKELKD